MGKIKRVLRCYNCGAVLQSKSEDESGFVNARFLESNRDDLVIYCQKCFDKMKVINSGALEQSIDDETIKILDDAKASDAIIVWVLDLFTFNGSFPPELIKKIKKLEVSVIATKRDLFSRSINDETFIRFINERFEEVGIKPATVTLLGTNDEITVKDLLANKDGQPRKGHDVYVIGGKNSGKTVLINKLLKTYKNKTKWNIKTEPYPGTSIRVLSIPLTNSTFLYELPGFSLATSVAGKVERDVVKIITPKRRVEDFSRPMVEGEYIVVGSVAAFGLEKGKPTTFKFYSAEGVETKKMRWKHIEDFIVENSKKVISRPASDHFTSVKDFDLFEYDMEDDGKLHDIAVRGLGWISFMGRGQTIRVMVPRGTAIKESLSKIRKE